ncbi:MAG: type IV toxin-antitoxin system AbiEi family antitoxin domain-containing protein [Candidatus Aminicenantes bacterium]|nr:type IV toxin-antitoxin system AbiEi family antitoxin domain-containing protein [Candidatus Aminicenantes bacterium]
MRYRTREEEAEIIFRERGGILRTSQAIAEGIHPRSLYSLRKKGRIVPLSRGLYRLADLPDLGNPDLSIVAARVPAAVICLISSLSFYRITNQVPHWVDIAIPRGKRTPRLDFPPLRIFRFSRETYKAGTERHDVDGIAVRIYAPARTIVDCFKFRNRIGIDIAVEALRLSQSRHVCTVSEILEYASLLRMKRVMLPYLEAIQ